MKVINNAIDVPFSKISVASCYEYEHSLYMRIMEVLCDNGMAVNCVTLETGLLYYMGPDYLVTPVEGAFIVEKRGVKQK